MIGVIKREFLLSTQPVEGNWKISVSAAEVCIHLSPVKYSYSIMMAMFSKEMLSCIFLAMKIKHYRNL